MQLESKRDQVLEPDEKAAMMAHVRAADFPETHSRWLALGREAGFSDARALFTDPLDLFRMYCFRAWPRHEGSGQNCPDLLARLLLQLGDRLAIGRAIVGL